jgi:GTP-binding protein HflX
MGLGRYEVDLYHESIIRQTAKIREKLRRIGAKRRLHRTRRLDLGFSLVSLSGYTNAGKSTLFNALAEESVPVDSGLFTTLSTTTREIELSKRKVLLTDTVGFIDRLPLTLIDAFHSTLEETIFSDLILLVVDVIDHQEEIARKLSSSLETIRKIGAAGIPTVIVLNKIDAVSENEMQSKLEAIKEAAPNPVPVSALHGYNLSFLKQEIAKHLENFIQVVLSMPVTDESMSFLSWLFNCADVHDLKYRGKMVDVVFSAIPKFVDEVKGRAEQFSGTLKT